MAFATTSRSATNSRMAWCRDSSSGARRIEDGWTVAVTFGATGEGPAFQVLLVAGLLADEHDLGCVRSLAEHGLGGVLVELARRAALDGLGELLQGGALGDQPDRRALLFLPLDLRRGSDQR